ncbi:MAG TPA: hypothetical protein VGR20_24880 [Acidimicrobiia bacterium]|nr:hypothetical protein [Acidimicrobiia bacterium]
MKNLRLAIFAALVGLLLGGLAPSPARAATPAQEDTWVGRVQRDGNHYDYVGSPCPESAQVCIKSLATYRIVPLNAAAKRAVRRLAGGQGRLTGRLQPGNDPGHGGQLLVRKAERQRPDSPRPLGHHG